jgi:hypothetical protein
MQIDRKLADTVYRLGTFVYAAFEALNPSQRLVPNWHIDAVCYCIQQMVTGQNRKRLVLNLPPRSLKSLVVSVCLPAWLLGRDPGARIICASYSQDLAEKFSRDCRALLDIRSLRCDFQVLENRRHSRGLAGNGRVFDGAARSGPARPASRVAATRKTTSCRAW